jgi:hypothetical protein
MKASTLDRRRDGSRWVFWVALVLLVANDHWLKHSQLAPGWLTGKLSDFAGLIVAPVLLAMLVQARSPRSRLACIAAVALVFACFELFPTWAAAVGQLAIGGHRLRMWPDLTDLLALAILPLTWRVMTPAPSVARAPLRLGTPLVHRAGIALASLACLATTGPSEIAPRLPLVVNLSHAPVTVTARRYLGTVLCRGEDASVSAPQLRDEAPLASDFGPAQTETIEPAEHMELGPLEGSTQTCTAYWISAQALGDLIITAEAVPFHDHEPQFNSLALEGPSSDLRSFANPGVWIAQTPAPTREAP